MVKRVLFGLMALALLVACNNQTTEEATEITTAEFTEKALHL